MGVRLLLSDLLFSSRFAVYHAGEKNVKVFLLRFRKSARILNISKVWVVNVIPACGWILRLSVFAHGWQCMPAGMRAKSAGRSGQRENKVSFHTSINKTLGIVKSVRFASDK
jgi:hypothetical protein